MHVKPLSGVLEFGAARRAPDVAEILGISDVDNHIVSDSIYVVHDLAIKFTHQ